MKSFLFVLTMFICSCGTTRIKRSDIIPITNKFAGVYDNQPYLIKSKQDIIENDSLTTAVNLFDTSKTRNPDLDVIQIHFNSSNQLIISYKDSSLFPPITLNGKFSKKGYYEIFFRNEQIEIPPVIHFLFSRHDIKRLRIYETKSNDLIIHRYYYDGGNFLIIGGDTPKKKQFYFRKMRNGAGD